MSQLYSHAMQLGLSSHCNVLTCKFKTKHRTNLFGDRPLVSEHSNSETSPTYSISMDASELATERTDSLLTQENLTGVANFTESLRHASNPGASPLLSLHGTKNSSCCDSGSDSDSSYSSNSSQKSSWANLEGRRWTHPDKHHPHHRHRAPPGLGQVVEEAEGCFFDVQLQAGLVNLMHEMTVAAGQLKPTPDSNPGFASERMSAGSTGMSVGRMGSNTIAEGGEDCRSAAVESGLSAMNGSNGKSSTPSLRPPASRRG